MPVEIGARRRPYQPRAHRRELRTSSGIPLPRIDQRTISAMRYRSLLDSYGAELGGHLSEPEKALVQQIAAMQVKIEQLQAAIVEGRDVDADQIIRLSSEHRRLLSSLRGKASKRSAPTWTKEQFLRIYVPFPSQDASRTQPTDRSACLVRGDGKFVEHRKHDRQQTSTA